MVVIFCWALKVRMFWMEEMVTIVYRIRIILAKLWLTITQPIKPRRNFIS